jgi:hypothetical protein
MNEAASRSLNELIAEHGAELADDPRRLEAFLRDYCPECRRETFALVAAARAGVPARLSASGHESRLSFANATQAKHLEDDYGLSTELARWAVNAWAGALGIEAQLEAGPPPVYTKALSESAAGGTTVRRPARPPETEQPSQEQPRVIAPRLDSAGRTPAGTLADAAREHDAVQPAPRRRRRTMLLVLAGIVAFLVALGAGALYGRAASERPSSTTVTSTSAPESSTSLASSTTVSPTTTQTRSSTTSSTEGPVSTTTTAKTTSTTRVLTVAQRIVCTIYGATVEVPAGWSATGLFTPSDYPGGKRFEALGPNGNMIRVDTLLKDEGTDLSRNALNQEHTVKSNHSDYQFVSRDWVTFAGTTAIIWKYHFEHRDLGPSDYTTIYLNPNCTGIVARVLANSTDDQREETMAIQQSFTLPSQ